MSGQPEYIPPPRGSNTGLIVGIVLAVVLLLIVVCGVGLLGVGFLAYRTVEVPMQQPQAPPGVPMPMEIPPPAEQPPEP